jgi:hypothetical protein
MAKRTNTFAAKMQAALDAQNAASAAYETGDLAEGRKQMLMAHDATSAAAREAEEGPAPVVTMRVPRWTEDR